MIPIPFFLLFSPALLRSVGEAVEQGEEEDEEEDDDDDGGLPTPDYYVQIILTHKIVPDDMSIPEHALPVIDKR